MEKIDIFGKAAGPVRTSKDLDLSTGKAVGAAFQATRLMAYAVNSHAPWSAADAARELGINPSTCFNLVQTLLAVGWLATADLIGSGKRYVLGSSFVNLAHRTASRTLDLREVMPRLQEFADRWKVTATIWHRQSMTRMELIAVCSCQTAVNVQMPLGQRLPVLMGGMGRIMALQGGLESSDREAMFNDLRWDRALSFAQFMSQARKARRIGWGLDDGYMNRSVTAIAVPVPAGADQAVEYSCSATMFRHQYASAVLPSMASALMPIADAVSALAYSN